MNTELTGAFTKASDDKDCMIEFPLNSLLPEHFHRPDRADIERGFRVLKSEIENAPVFHRLPDRIRAHALICFLALALYRVLRMRLMEAKDTPLSPERALEIVRRIQFHQTTLHQRRSASGLSALTQEQKDLFETIDLPEPNTKRL